MRRVNVVGSSGSGKTTFGATLARHLGAPLVELDALAWQPDWVATPLDELRERVTTATAGDAWVVDGNYQVVRDIVWARVDTVVWLDMSYPRVMWQVVARTFRRAARREVLWNGNRESLRTALLRRDSIILYAATEFHRRRRDYPVLFAQHPNLRVVRLRSPGQARRFLASVSSPGREPTAVRS